MTSTIEILAESGATYDEEDRTHIVVPPSRVALCGVAMPADAESCGPNCPTQFEEVCSVCHRELCRACVSIGHMEEALR